MLQKQIQFLNMCYKDMNKFNLYLSLAKKEVSCEPCLVMKKYNLWVIKNIYKKHMEDNLKIKFFSDIVNKFQCLPLSKLEDDNICELLIAYYCLGEVYIERNNREFAENNFKKIVTIMEENRYLNLNTNDDGNVTFFELSMWAKKNLGDINNNDEKSLEFYEGVVSDRELLFLEKNKSIYNIAKNLKNMDLVYESIINILKVKNDYENLNKESVVFLRENNEYFKCIDICYKEYIKNQEYFFVDQCAKCCKNDKKFNMDSVEYILNFCDLLLSDLQFENWSILIKALYEVVKDRDAAFYKFLCYIRDNFKKIDCKSMDYSYFQQSVDVLKNLYIDIYNKKYSKKQIREFEKDITSYFVNATYKNGILPEAFDSIIKLIYLCNNEDTEYLKEMLDNVVKNIKATDKKINEYPWIELVDKIKLIEEKGIIKCNINYNDQLRTSNDNLKLAFLSDKFTKETLLNKLLKNGNSLFTKKFNNGTLEVIDVNEEEKLKIVDLIVIPLEVKEREEALNKIRKYNDISKMHKVVFILDISSIEEDKLMEVRKFFLDNKENFNIVFNENNNYDQFIEFIEDSTPDNITMFRYNEFCNMINNEVEYIKDTMNTKLKNKKIEVDSMEEASFLAKELEDEIKINVNNFDKKISNDLIVLKESLESRLFNSIPSIVEDSLFMVDEAEDIKNLNEIAKENITELVNKWCIHHIPNILKKEFDLYMVKYKGIYEEQMQLINRVVDNRNKIFILDKEKAKDFKLINVISYMEMDNEFRNCFEEFLNDINYEFKIFNKNNILRNFAKEISSIFAKQDEKILLKKESIKNNILDQKDNIPKIICDFIFDNIEVLEVKLRNIAEDTFSNLVVTLEEDTILSNKIWDEKKLEYATLKDLDGEIQLNIDYIYIEIEKYKKQLSYNKLYYNGLIYLV